MRTCVTILAFLAALAMGAPVLACGQGQTMSEESAKLKQQDQEQAPEKATDQAQETQPSEEQLAFQDQLNEEEER
jgi:uncharacterized protein HemX